MPESGVRYDLRTSTYRPLSPKHLPPKFLTGNCEILQRLIYVKRTIPQTDTQLAFPHMRHVGALKRAA